MIQMFVFWFFQKGFFIGVVTLIIMGGVGIIPHLIIIIVDMVVIIVVLKLLNMQSQKVI